MESRKRCLQVKIIFIVRLSAIATVSADACLSADACNYIRLRRMSVWLTQTLIRSIRRLICKFMEIESAEPVRNRSDVVSFFFFLHSERKDSQKIV